jgi:polygalacturonase
MRPLSPAWLLCGLAAARAAVFDVINYGAEGDNTTDDTAAVRAAFAAAGSAGGGTVLFPMGKTFRTGPIVECQLAHG